MDLKDKIVESTKEIFSSMVMMEVDVLNDKEPLAKSPRDGISGVIGLAGTYKGALAIHFPVAIAIAITAGFIGTKIDEINEDVEDAVGELANMLGGSVKAILSENGRDIELSLPTTISGQGYDYQAVKNVDVTELYFSIDGGNFCVELQLER